jgi:hypothetical protein
MIHSVGALGNTHALKFFMLQDFFMRAEHGALGLFGFSINQFSLRKKLLLLDGRHTLFFVKKELQSSCKNRGIIGEHSSRETSTQSNHVKPSDESLPLIFELNVIIYNISFNSFLPLAPLRKSIRGDKEEAVFELWGHLLIEISLDQATKAVP